MCLWYNVQMSTKSNKASKNILAQLLATEGISVMHDPTAETAQFDILHRTLILPVWKDMSDSLYDMLVGHEVGHALFTPYNAEKEAAVKVKGPWNADAQEIGGDSHGHIAMAYLNIIEDARIEKLMKAKFPGLRHDFITAYGDLKDRNFFNMNDTKNKPLIDKINMHFKLGVSAETDLDITFTQSEMVFVDRIANAMTYDNVVQIVKDLWEYEIENSQTSPEQQPEYIPKDTENGDGPDADDTRKKSIGNTTGIEGGKKGGKNGNKPTAPSMPQSHDAYLSNVKTLIDDKVLRTQYTNLPESNLKNIIITPAEIEQIITSYSGTLFANSSNHSVTAQVLERFQTSALTATNKFIRASTKSVAILVKQFEMKKAADAHKRSLISKTGVLDCVKMMKYKFSDDVFARQLTIREGKNHGIVMFIDWSSSMSNIIDDTVKQCFIIALFCKKCNIPFDVYAFSSQNIRAEINKHGNDANIKWEDELDDKDHIMAESFMSEDQPLRTVIDAQEENYDYDSKKKSTASNYLDASNFSLLHFVSSSMSMKQMTKAMSNMMQVTMTYGSSSYDSYYMVNPCLRLNGTPLNECILAATDIVNLFRNQYKLQVVSSIFLTDGEAGSAAFSPPSKKEKSYVVNKKKKITYDIENLLSEKELDLGRWAVSTKILLRIHALETKANVLGFYLFDNASISESALRQFVDVKDNPTIIFPAYDAMKNRQEQYEEYNQTLKKAKDDISAQLESYKIQFKKNGYFVADTESQKNGYKELYVIRGSSLDLDDETNELDEIITGSTVTKVRTAFRNQMKDSAVSKNLLNRIIDNICI